MDIPYGLICFLVSGTVNQRIAILFYTFDPMLHGSGYGHTPVGTYHLYVYHNDGSKSSFKILANNLKK